MKKPIALIILDGQGVAPEHSGNAVKLANTPNLDKWTKEFPNILMNASETLVGLPLGQMGNSEVGHLNIGAGRVVNQSLAIINKVVSENSFVSNDKVIKAIKHAKDNNSKVNILGLISDGGVHSHIEHIISMVKTLEKSGVEYVLHAYVDGRDVDQKSAKRYLDLLVKNGIPISTITGRFYSMDRDKRWDRVQLAYDVLVERKGVAISDIDTYIKEEYKAGRTDEFFMPGFIKGTEPINNNDSIISINFRPDRAREMSHLLIGSNIEVTGYEYEPKQGKKENIYFTSIREYSGIEEDIMFPPTRMKNLIGEVLENNGLKQMRAAETEKYPHVTFFMDGGQDIKKKGEVRILVDSPKVPTYDKDPEMSCRALTEKIIKNIDDIDALFINFAQPDMVGHTGVLKAVIKAVEVGDEMLKKLYQKIVEEMGGVLLIVADHGNAEKMINDDGSVCTTHTTNLVRLIITDKSAIFKDEFKQTEAIAKLGDLAPTMLKYLGVKIPDEMTGKVLVK